MENAMSEVIIIGGGAAGMMAAVAAAEKGHQVMVLEQNEKLGKKVFITGKGRCNVTNACDTEELFRNVCRNSKFLYSSFYGFDNFAVMDFFQKNGCSLKVERGNRVFPVSDHSSDIIKTLEKKMKALGVTVLLQHKVKELLFDKEKILGVVTVDGRERKADAVIVATGGKSYESTGSTGDGYRFATQAGLSVTPLYPSLVPLEVEEEWCPLLQGLSLKNVRASVRAGKKEVFSELGEMLFTHFGISGPLILSASTYVVDKIGREDIRVYIDLKPALSEEQLDKRLLRDFDGARNKQFKNACNGLLPSKMLPLLPKLAQIDENKQINSVTKEERGRLVHILKNLELTVTGTRGYQEAIITRGGIDVREINPSTMESKKIQGLYFAGEVLDLDAVTGGFNLQIAWSNGHLAGDSIPF